MGESDIAHMNNIRTDLLNYGYTTVDQIYDPGATAAQVTTSVNQGRGFINYVGHGADTYWVTTNFNNNNANALTNDYMLPFIVSVACVNGNFVSQTCFAEAWMRSVNETTNAPAGASLFGFTIIKVGLAYAWSGRSTDLLLAIKISVVVYF
jgi:gingipain R